MRRVPFQKQVLGPVTPAVVLGAGYWVILVIWIRDPFATSSEIGTVFEKEWHGILLPLYAWSTYPPTLGLVILGGVALVWIYRM